MDHTFVICAYKESPYLEKCIQSLKNQSVTSEIVLSTSTPSEYLQEMCKRYDIKYYVREGKPGIGVDWNYGLSLVETQYATIAHQDDLYEPQYTEIVLSGLSKDASSIIAFTDYSELVGVKKEAKRINLRIKRLLLLPIKVKKWQNKRWCKRFTLRFGNAISCPTVTYHMEYIRALLKNEQRHDLFQTHFRSNLDWEAWEWLSNQNGGFVYIPKVLMAHRIHEGSETSAVIQENQRGNEDYEMFCRFGPNGLQS